MTDYLTEQEQIEILKGWIKQYSFVVILGLALAAVAIFGWRYWQERQMRTLTNASIVYDQMLTARAQNNIESTTKEAQSLFSQYPKTAYGVMAALELAKLSLQKKNYRKAEEYFNWVISNNRIDSVTQIARIRLARVFIAQKKYDDALKALEVINDSGMKGLATEVKGDVYYGMQNFSEARKAYGEALKEIPNAENIRPLLQMKYDNLTT